MSKVIYLLVFLTFNNYSFLVNACNGEWWTHTLVYEVFVRSFQDTDDDGIGDLNGVTQHLDYFADIGVGAIYLSAIYDSPMVDQAYDVRDFRKVSPEYGTMEDFENLIKKANKLNMKVLLDFVPNQCSNESHYFINSAKRVEGYEDFIVWADGVIDPETDEMKPPNNWESYFSGSAWTWNEEREQYYLHHYAKQQPEFNYRNPDVFDEITDIMIFYLDKGVHGFRIDSAVFLVEAMNPDGTYPDDPVDVSNNETIGIYSRDRNESFDIIYRWRSILDNYSKNKDGVPRVMMTEAYTNLSFTMRYFGNGTHNGSRLPFNFDLITKENRSSDARYLVSVCERWLVYVPSGSHYNWVVGNRDVYRMATFYGQIKMDGITMLAMILPGTVMTYQGDEIGMTNGYVSYEDTQDIYALTVGNKDNYLEYSRDVEKTPFHWNDSKNAGFSNASKTWLPVADNYKQINLKKQKDKKSHYNIYKTISKARNNMTALKCGAYDLKPITDEIFALTRSYDGYYTVGMAMNLGSESSTVDISNMRGVGQNLEVFTSSLNSMKNKGDEIKSNQVSLEGGESFMFKSQPPRQSNQIRDN